MTKIEFSDEYWQRMSIEGCMGSSVPLVKMSKLAWLYELSASIYCGR